MIFRVRSLGNCSWSIAPDCGKLEGESVIEADGVSMHHVKFYGKTVIGIINAVWGAKNVIYDIYEDPCIVQGLGFGKPLYTRLPERLTLDYDGFLDASNTRCKRASRLLLIGQAVYAKGAE